MGNKDNFLGNLYNDFFNSNFTRNNNDKINEELATLTEELKKLNDSKATQTEESISDIINRKKAEENVQVEEEQNKEDKNNKLQELFERIDELNVTDESKETLKKMMGYAKKYSDKEITKYIPFDMRLYSDNRESTKEVIDLIAEGLGYFKYINGSKTYDTSFYHVDAEAVFDLYKSSYNVLVFKDLDGIKALKKIDEEGLLTLWEEKLLEEKQNRMTIIVEKNSEKIDSVFENHIVLRDRIFDFKIQIIKPDAQDIYQTILDRIEKEYEVEDDFKVALLDYIVATYPKTEMTFPEYRDSIYEKILFNAVDKKITKDLVPNYEKDKSIEEIFAELNELVGLKNVKDMLNDLVSLMQFKEKAGDEVKLKDTNLHMIFLGNPGTGKTTVARMVAGILYNLKYVKQNKLIEVSAKDLVGEYVGQTAPKTMAVIEKAMGGVLFIDEAYSLASKPGQNNTFNEECVATLIQAMENYRDNLVVILAGYTKEMQDFLNTNSGIVSRIGYTMEFQDYTVDELIVIFKGLVSKAGFMVDDSAIKEVEKIIKEYKDTKNFGNARFVRSMYEKTVIKHATNCKDKKAKKRLKTITKDDISVENLLKM